MKVEIEPGELEKHVGLGIRATIMAGAVELIVKELTPDRLKEFATNILEEGLQRINGWELKEKVNKMAQPAIDKMLSSPEVQERINAAAVEGMKKFLDELPDAFHKHFKEVVTNALLDRRGR